MSFYTGTQSEVLYSMVTPVGSPASVVVMAPSGTVFLEPDGTWWRVFPAYRSYPT